MFLDLAVPLMPIAIYLDSRRSVGVARSGGPGPDHADRRNSNLLFISLTLTLTATLARMADVDRDLCPYLHGTIAFMAVLNMTIHWLICRSLARLNETSWPIPPVLYSMHRDRRRINYFDQAAYWTLVFEGLPFLWRIAG